MSPVCGGRVGLGPRCPVTFASSTRNSAFQVLCGTSIECGHIALRLLKRWCIP